MAKQTALDLKRKEVREEILVMKSKTPSARILNLFGTVFRKGSLGYWLSNIVLLSLLLLGPWLLLGPALHENYTARALWAPSLIAVIDVVSGLIVGHLVVQNILDDLANRIIEKMDNADDLSKFLHWLK